MQNKCEHLYGMVGGEYEPSNGVFSLKEREKRRNDEYFDPYDFCPYCGKELKHE